MYEIRHRFSKLRNLTLEEVLDISAEQGSRSHANLLFAQVIHTDSPFTRWENYSGERIMVTTRAHRPGRFNMLVIEP